MLTLQKDDCNMISETNNKVPDIPDNNETYQKNIEEKSDEKVTPTS